jgi:glyoxylase-like metal-dependent hydrolase (beta-lactamase superfamily II)
LEEDKMDIYPLDLKFQGHDEAIAAYLVIGPEGPVLVETGPASTVKALQARLAEHGYTPADIRHVLVTHIHLDHAGAAGWWAQQGATVYVHHVGAPHLIDPARLLSSAARIYGEDMDRLWGQTQPAPATQVRALYDGDVVRAGGLDFSALDTPGHANHHMVYRLDGVAFTGDIAGVRLPGSTFISVPAPPPEFDLPAWQGSIQRLLDEELETIYPTHYGPIATVREHLERVSQLVESSAKFLRDRMHAGLDRDALVEEYQDWVWERARARGVSQERLEVYETANPSFMSVDGLMRYWGKRART